MEATLASSTPATVQYNDRDPIFVADAARELQLTLIGGLVFGNAACYAHLITTRITQMIHLSNLRAWQVLAARSSQPSKPMNRRGVRSE